jgi:signal transduction histidine kinase
MASSSRLVGASVDVLPASATLPAAVRHLLEARLEHQARSIGQAIHDGAGQLLAAAYLSLEEVKLDLPAPAASRLLTVRRHLDAIEDQLRQLARELKPRVLDEFGLDPALRSLAHIFTARFHSPALVDVRLDRRLPQRVELSVYRIVEEALTNAGRHAQAAHVSVLVRADPRTLCCTVGDDGVGFDAAEIAVRPNNPGLGLQGIRERVDALGGRLWIRSAVGLGTQLTVSVPTDRLNDSGSPRRRSSCGPQRYPDTVGTARLRNRRGSR